MQPIAIGIDDELFWIYGNILHPRSNYREEVGDVTYVELFNDENDKPRGCGILEFATEEMAKRAVEKMHRHEFRGRKLVVKEVISSHLLDNAKAI